MQEKRNSLLAVHNHDDNVPKNCCENRKIKETKKNETPLLWWFRTLLVVIGNPPLFNIRIYCRQSRLSRVAMTTTVNDSQSTTDRDLDCEFSGPAGVRGSDLDCEFPGPAGVRGVGFKL